MPTDAQLAMPSNLPQSLAEQLAQHFPLHLQQQLQQRLQQCLQQWPHWQAVLDTPPQLISCLGSGLSHYNFRVRSGTQDFVVRLESATSRQLAMSSSDERYWLAACVNFAPAVVWFDHDVLVTQYLYLPHWQAPDLLPLIGKTLAQLHQLTIPKASVIQTSAAVQTTGPAPLDLIAHTERYWQQLQKLQSTDQYTIQQVNPQDQRLHRYMREHITQTLQQFSKRCLCHNDLHASNILLDEQRCIFLDWEYAAINAPGFDLASLAESASLTAEQLQLLVDHYQPDAEQQPALLAEIACYRPIVRYLEWLWLSLRERCDDSSELITNSSELIIDNSEKTARKHAWSRLRDLLSAKDAGNLFN